MRSFLFTWFPFFWIALCAESMVLQSRILLDLPLSFGWEDGFILFGTPFAYFVHHSRPTYKQIAGMFGLAAVGCSIMRLNQGQFHGFLFAGIVAGLLWLGYYGLALPYPYTLRNRVLAKPVIIAVTWVAITLFLPVPIAYWPQLGLPALARATFIFSLALAYDLTDLQLDIRQGLHTLAGKLGTKPALRWMKYALLVSGLFSALDIWVNPDTFNLVLASWAGLGLSAIVLQTLAWYKPGVIWVKPLIDGMMPLQTCLIWLVS